MTMKPFCIRCGGLRIIEVRPNYGTCQECGLILAPLDEAIKTMEETAKPLIEMADEVIPKELGVYADVTGMTWTLDANGWSCDKVTIDPTHTFMLVPQAPFTKVDIPDDIGGLVDL